MGMFDYVNYSAKCQFCGHLLRNWQSKDHDCDLSQLEISQVTRFYDFCHKCQSWNEYLVIDQNKAISNHSRCHSCSQGTFYNKCNLPITCKTCQQSIVGCRHVGFCCNRCQEIHDLIPIEDNK